MSAWQPPTSGKLAQSFAKGLAVVMHPAFRLGFLDAQANRPLDHDLIIERIWRETPAGALERLGWDPGLPFSKKAYHNAELAQYRYEEGRLLQRSTGIRCKAWGHPDKLPVVVAEWVRQQFPVTISPPSEEDLLRQREHNARHRAAAEADRRREAEPRWRQGRLAL